MWMCAETNALAIDDESRAVANEAGPSDATDWSQMAAHHRTGMRKPLQRMQGV